nr:MAG TPA: Minor structural protein [Bacteriophage sp.]
MAVEHIQENDTLNAGRVKINQAIDLSNTSSKKVDQFAVDLNQGIQDAKKIATDAGQAAKTTADTAAAEAKQTASNAATEATNIAEAAGQEAKNIAETAGTEANKKADQAISDSKTAVDTSNQAVGRANQNKQEFDALRNEFDDLVAESGDSNPEIVQARTDTQGVKQNTLQNRLAADFGIRLTNADAIKLFSGPVDVPKMMDFAGKVAGNTLVNPHSAYTDYTATSLKKPSATWTEISQENYNKLVGRDDSGVSIGSSQGSVIPQLLDKADTVKAIEQLAPRIFEGMTLAEKVKYMKDNFISISLTIRAKASSPNNKNLKVALYLESTDTYTTKIQGDATEFTDFTVEVNDSNFIDSKGFINVLVYCDSSNGVTAANINVDYIGVQLKVSLNPLTVLNQAGFANENDLALKANLKDFQDFVMRKDNPHSVTASQAGAYSKTETNQTFLTKADADTQLVKVSDFNKTNLDLGNIDNYATATVDEAANGSASNKFVTPAGVKSYYEKQVINRSKYLSNNVNYCAHRGNNADYPENSLLALKSVSRHRFIEFDIGITKDSRWVVMHDDTVDRMTNGTGRVDSFTYAQIRALRIDSGANVSVLSDSEKVVPSLEEAIECCKIAGGVPFIEIKSNAYTDAQLQGFMAILNHYKVLNDGCVVISFDKSILERLRNMSNEIELAWVLNSVTQTELNECIRLRMSADVAYNHATVTKEMAQKFHDNGLQFNVWTAPDEAFQPLKDKGVDIITTDSRSGDLRWSELSLDNGFIYNSGGLLRKPFVEEVSQGVARVTFTLSGGVNDKNKRIMILPAWATPLYNSWHSCTVRTSNGASYATVDVFGKVNSGGAGDIIVGLDWGVRNLWVNGSFTYDLH